MKFGLIISKQHPPGVSMVERFREHIEQVPPMQRPPRQAEEEPRAVGHGIRMPAHPEPDEHITQHNGADRCENPEHRVEMYPSSG